ncbi:MAG: spore maturation protein [Oscillospiraceae bacterium]|nr:spore maturation protein [Oscillospiraceae bacterium]
MSLFTNSIIPLIIAVIVAVGLVKRVDIVGSFTEGARDNLAMCGDLLPTLILLITAIGMLRASGAIDLLTAAVSSFADYLGFPEECLPLALIRPISGSGALAVYEDTLESYHPDSFVGRVASVMLGSTETTFYTIAVYYGAARIKNTRHTLSAALTGDLTGFIFSVLTVRLLFGE